MARASISKTGKAAARAGGGPAPYYEPAMREIIERGDLAMMKLLLEEAKIIKQRFGSVEGAIADLEAALKKL